MTKALLAVAALLGFLLAGVAYQPAIAQDYDSLRNQMNQLRQQMRQLSNQVNDLSRRGGAPEGGSEADFDSGGSSAERASLFARLDEISESMRRINGRLEELEFKVNNLSSGLDLVRRESDLRVADGGASAPDAGAGSEPSAAAAPAAESRPASEEGGPVRLTPSNTGGEGPSGATGEFDQSLGPRSLGTLPLEPGEAPPRPAAGSATREPPPAPPEPAGDEEAMVASIAPATPKEQYDAAQKLLKNAQYAEAEAAFRSYIEANPKDGNVEKASYWLGETFYARKNFTEASRIYARNVQQWPKGDKAPDNLVKLSLALINLKRAGEACQFLVVLDTDYPNAAQNVKQAAERAKKQAKCS